MRLRATVRADWKDGCSMASNADMRKLMVRIRNYGWHVEIGGSGHWQVRHPETGDLLLSASATPGDRNAHINAARDARRAGIMRPYLVVRKIGEAKVTPPRNPTMAEIISLAPAIDTSMPDAGIPADWSPSEESVAVVKRTRQSVTRGAISREVQIEMLLAYHARFGDWPGWADLGGEGPAIEHPLPGGGTIDFGNGRFWFANQKRSPHRFGSLGDAIREADKARRLELATGEYWLPIEGWDDADTGEAATA
jgi:hypothetical protein